MIQQESQSKVCSELYCVGAEPAISEVCIEVPSILTGTHRWHTRMIILHKARLHKHHLDVYFGEQGQMAFSRQPRRRQSLHPHSEERGLNYEWRVDIVVLRTKLPSLSQQAESGLLKSVILRLCVIS